MFKVGRRWKFVGMFTALVGLLEPSLTSAQTAVIQSPEYSKGGIGTQDRVGIGVDVGYPFVGLNLKYFFNSRNALQFSVGWNATQLSEGADAGFTLKGQYVAHIFQPIDNASVTMPLYIGLGLGYTFNVQEEFSWFDQDFILNSDLFSVVVPLGAAMQLKSIPVDLYLQLEPGFYVQIPPDSDVNSSDVIGALSLAFGGRWYF